MLVIGGSGGYGLASRIVAAFGAGARTLCLSFEKNLPPTVQGHRLVQQSRVRSHGRRSESDARSLSGDVWRRGQVAGCRHVRSDLGGLDLLVYSVAARSARIRHRRAYRSAIKPVAATSIPKR